MIIKPFLITALIACAYSQDQDLDAIPCTIDNKQGECVKLYQCPNGTLIDTGENIIDIRIPGECEDYLLKCCAIDDIDTIAVPPSSSTNYTDDGIAVPPKSEPQITEPPSSNRNPTLDNNGETSPSTPPPNHKPIIPHVPTFPSNCGVRNVDGIGFRITGNNDNEAEYAEFPWMVAVLKEESALDQVINVYQCGGSLISPGVVLTAAHCVQNKKSAEIKVRLGEWDTQTKNEIYDHQDRNVINIVKHENYYKGGLFNDVALLFLDKPAIPNESIGFICLPPIDYNFDHQKCTVTGWGKDVFGKEGKYQVILKKIDLPIMPRDQCQTNLRTTRLGRRFKLHESFICAGGELGKDACKGDGGSPLMCPIPGTRHQYYIAGMVAWGIGCGERDIPGVYANVAHFRHWIDAKMQENNAETRYYQHRSESG